MWLDVVSGLLDTGKGYLQKAAELTTSDNDASQLVIDAEMIGNNAYQFLQQLEGADADQIPHQIVGPFQRWVDGLGINNTIFFRADHVANYELKRFPLKYSLKNLNSPSKSLNDAVDAVKWPFLRLTVPSQALGMLPHFSIVGHELGHAIQNRINPDLSSFDLSPFATELKVRLSSEGVNQTAQHVLLTQQILASWIEEIKSDAVGFVIAGPAFFFALGSFFELSGGGFGIGTSHPPSEMRRRLIFDQLNKGTPSHAEVFERQTGVKIEEDTNSPHLKLLPTADDLYKLLKPIHGIDKAAICVALIPIAESIASTIFDEAEKVLRSSSSDMVYGPNRLEADLEKHLEPLCYLVPPIEHRSNGSLHPCSLAGILNIGWAALLTRLDRIPISGDGSIGNDNTIKMEKLHELLLKAVELAEARMVWEEQP